MFTPFYSNNTTGCSHALFFCFFTMEVFHVKILSGLYRACSIFFSEELFQQNKEDECLPSVLYDLFYIFLVIYIVNNLMKVGPFCCCAGGKFCTQ